MQITARADYAVRACAELAAAHGTGPVKGDRIAAAQCVPIKFLENILVDLRRAGLVASRRGADGGYWLARPPERITIADIVRATDGPLAAVRGELPDTLEYAQAAEHLTEVWVAVRASLRSVLDHVTLAALVGGDLPDHVRALLDDPDAWTSQWG